MIDVIGYAGGAIGVIGLVLFCVGMKASSFYGSNKNLDYGLLMVFVSVALLSAWEAMA